MPQASSIIRGNLQDKALAQLVDGKGIQEIAKELDVSEGQYATIETRGPNIHFSTLTQTFRE